MPEAKRLEEKQLLRAVEALQAHVTRVESKKKPQLLDQSGDQFIFVVIALKKPNARVAKQWPLRIPLNHPISTSGQVEVCLFSKDDKPAVRKLLETKGIRSITKVIPFNKLKTHYKTFEQRRQLASMYDLFLVDRRISHLVVDRLGKSFVQKKNHPYPVTLTKPNLAREIENAIGSTYLRMSPGSSLTVRIGRVSMPSSAVVENIISSMSSIVQHISKGWSNVQAINIKTIKSIALPIFNTLPTPPTLLPKLEKPARVSKLETVEENEPEQEMSVKVSEQGLGTPSQPKPKAPAGHYSAKRVRGSLVTRTSKKRKSM